MVITHKKSTKLENAYYNIIWRLNNAGIKYETENNIIPQYNPDARDENGNPYPEPDPDTVGTGTAWIKIFHEDRKIVFVYFCCHLVECKTCTYDRFITVYNYTDDVGDTALQGMLPVLTLKYYADRAEDDKDRTIYFDEFSLEDLSLTQLSFKKPILTQAEATCETCHGKGTVETKTTVPSGNPYKQPIQITINTTCPDCHGTGKTIEDSPDNYATINKFNVYGFYVKKSAEERDLIDNRINDGVREGLPDDDPSNLGEGGLIKYAKRLYTDENSYDPDDTPTTELSKITTYNTQLYVDENGKPVNTLEELYELIEKTNVKNNSIDANPKSTEEKVDLSKYLFAIPIFKEYINTNGEEPKTDYKLVDFRFYQTNYVDQYGKLIPITAFCSFNTERESPLYFINGYNTYGYSDLDPSIDSYTYDIFYSIVKGIKNFTKHCGEIETYRNSSGGKPNVIIRPLISTFVDVSQTDRVWNFICYKDKNLPIVPYNKNTLYISKTTWPYKMDLYKDEHVKFDNILAQKTAAYVEPLDSTLLSPDDDPSQADYVYPVDSFKGSVGLNTFKDIHTYGSMVPFEYSLYIDPTSNNNTVNCENGASYTYPDNIPGIVFRNKTNRIALGIKIHAEFHESYDDAVPNYSIAQILRLDLALQDMDEDGHALPDNIHHLSTYYVDVYTSDIEKYYNPENTSEVLYKWPMTLDKEIRSYIDSYRFPSSSNPGLEFPFKNKRLLILLDRINYDWHESSDISKNPYNYDDVNVTIEVSLTTNMESMTDKYGYPIAGVENISLLPKIEYNYNNYPEGVFKYYQSNYGTYIENYIFHKYKDNMMYSVLDTEGDDESVKLIPDTIESQKEYHGFLNIMFDSKLRSIYRKMDTHNDFITCPACNGKDDIECGFCNNKRKLSIYDCNVKSITSDEDMQKLLSENSLFRYVCPDINNIDHDNRSSCQGRCRCCAGTKSVVRYYYLKTFDFKNLTVYNGKLPEEIDDLSDIEKLHIIDKVLEAKVKEVGNNTVLPYLNYIVNKHYDVPEELGEELDFDTYYELYNAAANNLVFYILNGNFIAYYYWNGRSHVKVDYGYNYIYSTKTYTKKEWKKIKDTNDAKINTVLYRIISAEQDVDDMIGFYVINIQDITKKFDNFEGCTVQRIYFDKSWVYSNLLSDMTFKHFNMFTEKENLIVGNHQQTEDYIHIHDEEEDTVQSRCPQCGGTGEIDGEKCETCNGTGDYPDNVQADNLVYTRQLYCYTSMPYINTDNMSFEVNDQILPKLDNNDIDEINYEE